MPAFPPILGANPKILVLGSMPGQRSLDEQQYYAHPRNAFWPIMAELYQFELTTSYAERKQQLVKNHTAVWDVLHNCERPGSLDQNIVKESEQANDFATFFLRHPSIEIVGFNGQAARKIFNRHCKSLYNKHPKIRWVDLPSTSPAHASLSWLEKCKAWREQLFKKPKPTIASHV